MRITGTAEFIQSVRDNLNTITGTDVGRDLMDEITLSGRTVTITETARGNSQSATGAGGNLNADGTPGAGTDTTVNFNPNRNNLGSPDAWETRPPDVGLFHELVHAHHDMNGTTATGNGANPVVGGTVPNYELQTVGLGDHSGGTYTENNYRGARGLTGRDYY